MPVAKYANMICQKKQPGVDNLINRLYNVTHTLRLADVFLKVNWKQKMKANCFNRQHFNTIAKQAGVMPGSWLAINSLSNDRTPVEIYTSRVHEGYDD